MLSVSPVLLERYLSAAATISALAVGDPRIIAGSETYRIRGDASQIGQDEALPPGTRGGLMALHTFPLDGEYVIKVKLLEINLGSIRGLEYEHQLEVMVDGERVLLAPVGGPEDYTQSSLNATNVVNSLAERLQVRVKVEGGPAAGRCGVSPEVRGAGSESASGVSAKHAHRDGSSRPAARREHHRVGAVQCHRRDRDSKPSASVHLSAREGAGRARMREADHHDVGSPCVSPAGDRLGYDELDVVL